MKNILLALLLLLPFSFSSPAKSEDIPLIRLHVIANSDSEYDQKIKLLVRDAVLVASKNLSPEQIPASLGLFKEAAQAALYSNGCNLPAEAQFGVFHFPTKTYGNVTLPAGEYTAVRIIIGEGQGKNWWCVLYPPLCFTDETTAHFDKDFITKNGQTQSGRPKFKIKFKLAEIFS